jgi:hypothetical protein
MTKLGYSPYIPETFPNIGHRAGIAHRTVVHVLTGSIKHAVETLR